MSFYIVSTPIGNLDDLTVRAEKVLRESSIILCEKKERALKLVSHLGLKNLRLISYHDDKVDSILKKVLENNKAGKNISLISDAGTPLISDPGNSLIKKLIHEGIEPIAIPGPTSIIPALLLSAFDISKFIYLGFMSKSKAKIQTELELYLDANLPVIILTSMNDIRKIVDILSNKNEIFNLSISKELTKKNEKTFRFQSNQFDKAKLKDFISKGEFVTIIQKLNTSKNSQINHKKIKKRILELKKLNYSKNDIVKIIVKNESIKKNLAYNLVIKYWE